MNLKEKFDQMREQAAHFCLEHPVIAQAIPRLLLGEDDRLLTRRITSVRQQEEILTKWKQKTYEQYTPEAADQYRKIHGRAGLLLDLLVETTEEVVGEKKDSG